MGSRATRTKLKELETRCAQLERQAKQLQEEKQRATYSETLLSSICDIFTMVQISNGLRVVGTQDDVPEHSRDRVQQLLQQEACLLSQLTMVPPKPVPEILGVPVLGVSTAAPRTDPLALLKYCLCQDEPEAGTATSKQLAQKLATTVLECSVQLHLLQRPDVPESQVCLDRMRELWLRYMRLMAPVTVSARSEVVDGVSAYNLATLQQDAEAGPKQREQETLPGLLDLTDEQVQEIVLGTAVFKNLQSSILQELQQLQAEVMAKTGMSDDSSSSPSESSCCSTHLVSGSGSGSTLEDRQLSLHGILGDLEQHMRHTDRIQLLLHKEMTVRAAAVAWLMGCLDWRQITKVAILCWPYPWRASAFGQAVCKYAACREGPQKGQGQGHGQRNGHSSTSSG